MTVITDITRYWKIVSNEMMKLWRRDKDLVIFNNLSLILLVYK